jgi:molybdopterin synthase sulfur carrier subunit
MKGDAIKVKVKLFAAYQQVFGKEELELELTEPTSVINVLDSLIQEKPQLEPWRNLTRFGVNLKFVAPDTLLQDKDEMVLIPPVSGG